MIDFTCSAPDKATVDMNGGTAKAQTKCEIRLWGWELVIWARAPVRSLKNQLLTFLIALSFLDTIGTGERALLTCGLELLNQNFARLRTAFM